METPENWLASMARERLAALGLPDGEGLGDLDFSGLANMQENLARNLNPPLPKLPEIRLKTLTMKEMKAKSTDDLLAFLLGDDGNPGMISLPMQQAVRGELIQRASRPHWTVVPAFITGVLAVAFSAVAVFISYLAYRQSRLATVQAPPASVQPPGSAQRPQR